MAIVLSQGQVCVCVCARARRHVSVCVCIQCLLYYSFITVEEGMNKPCSFLIPFFPPVFSTNLERNVRWLANANALPSAPIALSAPKNNCRRTTRRPSKCCFLSAPLVIVLITFITHMLAADQAGSQKSVGFL